MRAEQDRLNHLDEVLSKLNSRINVERDPYRLLIPTVEWKQKMRKVADVDALFEQTKEERLNTNDIVHVQQLYVTYLISQIKFNIILKFVTFL